VSQYSDYLAGDMMNGLVNVQLEYALNLLGVKEFPGTERQCSLLAEWVKKLSEVKGEDYVRQQNERLIFQWQNIVKEFLNEHRYRDYLS
jgi:hypothetical protein